ncbi:YceI family protein [Xanthomonas fragariae]|uniref:YceI family protein n=1 Tax=Xanthomonas fragariae TaxID=48664 RepID=UPI001ABE9C10|nr:YceI family protein [Xanthomonas fragariae]UKR51812.1 YceI family protein [Xanthomonas fragariae]
MTTFARLLVFPALVVTSLAATAAPVRYALDPVHTRVLFAVEHSGFSKALGTVSGSNGTLVFDPDDWAAARLDVTVPLRRADLGDTKWTDATLARNLLDAERFPDAHFVSTRVEASGQNHAKVTGNLTLRGVTRPVTLEVTLNALKRHPLPPFRRTAGFSATATLSRAEFGIDAWKSMIGDKVELRIEAEAVREGREDDAPEPQTAPATPDAAASAES